MRKSEKFKFSQKVAAARDLNNCFNDKGSKRKAESHLNAPKAKSSKSKVFTSSPLFYSIPFVTILSCSIIAVRDAPKAT
jgi:hypothetical protein